MHRTLLLLVLVTAPAPKGETARDTLLVEEPSAARSEPVALVAAGTALEVLEERDDGWARVRLEGWVRQAALEEKRGDRVAPALFRMAEAALEEDAGAGGLEAPGVRLREVRQIRVTTKGAAARITFLVVFRNEGRLPLAGLRVLLEPLDARGREIRALEGILREPEVLRPGQEASLELSATFTASQLKRLHRRRHRVRFFLEANA